MPASERSLLITDAYRARLAALAARIAAHTRTSWQTIRIEDLDRSHAAWLNSTVATLEQAQRAGVNLTLAYLAAFTASETGQPATPATYDPSAALGAGEDGQPLAEPLAKTVIAVKTLIKDGKQPAQALTETGHRAERLASGAFMAAPRTALADQIRANPILTGWRRVTTGGCGACIAASTRDHASDEPLRVHAHCRCTQEPIVLGQPDRAPRATGPEIFARMSRAEQDQALGPRAAEAVRTGQVAWPDLIQTDPMNVGPDWITQRPIALAQ